jgi:hypothetical protein
MPITTSPAANLGFRDSTTSLTLPPVSGRSSSNGGV